MRGAYWRHTGRKEQPHSPTVIEVVERPMQYRRQRRPLCCIWRAHGIREVNHTHMSELLSEREGIDITRSTLRRLLVNAGENSPRRRRPPKHRVRRQRMPREGMLIQVDGSYHRWLGKDGPQFTLLLAIDDASGVSSMPCSANWRTPTATSRSSMD